jgi:hypothetical protein
MFTSEPKELTDVARVFLEPANATHRQYEALREFFVAGVSGVEVARRFGYTPGSFRVLVHQFRQNPHRPFLLTPAKGPQSAPKSDPLRDLVIALGSIENYITTFARVVILVNKGYADDEIAFVMRRSSPWIAAYCKLYSEFQDKHTGRRRIIEILSPVESPNAPSGKTAIFWGWLIRHQRKQKSSLNPYSHGTRGSTPSARSLAGKSS